MIPMLKTGIGSRRNYINVNGYFKKKNSFPANIYLFKVNNRSIRKKSEIRSKLTINATERRQWRCFGVFVVNFF